MILYDEHMRFSMADFGIDIPIFDSRASKAFGHLADHTELGSRCDEWRCRPGTEILGKGDLLRVHELAHVDRLFSDEREAELIRTYELVDSDGNYNRYDPDRAVQPLTELLDRILVRASGTLQCCRKALADGFCFYFGGGMHHAQYQYGKGFCPINDIVIAIRRLQAEGSIQSVWVIDVDAHKGDGTAALTENDHTVTTLSVHMGNGWPLDEPAVDPAGVPNPSFISSDIDVPMAAGEDHLYLPRLADALERLSQYPSPDLAVVVSGSDPYEKDALPSTADLQLSLAQLMDRDRMVYRFLMGRRIPSAYLMAGGYGHDSWEVYARFLEWVLAKRLSGGVQGRRTGDQD